jgi:transcription elongation factor
MKRSLFIGLALAVVLVVCGWLVYRNIFSNEELASKVEWSIVQAVESQHHDKPGDEIEVVKMDDYSLVGIPVHDTRKEIWIMLNSRNSPYYKQLPQGSYALSKEDLKKILASGVVASTVENCLESHLEDPK